MRIYDVAALRCICLRAAIGIPYCRCVFQDGTHCCCICCSLDWCGVFLEVASNEVYGPVSFHDHVWYAGPSSVHYIGPNCSKQTGLCFGFKSVSLSQTNAVCYDHGHHGICSNPALLRMIWSGKHQCVILEDINNKKQQCFVKNNHFCAMNFMTKFCRRHILFLSEHIFGHTKPNKLHPRVVWSVW